MPPHYPMHSESARAEAVSARGGVGRHFGKDGWCRCAFSAGTRHFFGHCLTIVFFVLLIFVAATWFLPDLSLKNSPAIQAKLNQFLDGSGIQVDFQNIKFVSGKGIRVSGVRAFFEDAPEVVGGHLVSSVSASEGSQNKQGSFTGRFRPVSFSKPTKQVVGRCQVSVDEIWILGKWSLVDFLDSDFSPSQIDLVGANLRLRQDESGRIVIPKIRLPQSDLEDEPFHRSLKKIRLVDSTISLSSPNKKQPLILRNINVELGRLQETTQQVLADTPPSLSLQNESASNLGDHDAARKETKRFVPVVARENGLESGLANQSMSIQNDATGNELSNQKRGWEVYTSFRPEGFDPIEITGHVSKEDYRFEVQTEAIHIHHRFWEMVGPFLPLDILSQTRISGWVHVTKLVVEGKTNSFSSSPISKFDFQGSIKEGLIRDPRLAQPIMDISTQFQFNQNGGTLSNIQAKVAGGTIQGGFKKISWANAQCEFFVVGGNLPCGPEWVPVLLPQYQRKYPDFQPEGRFDCNLVYQMNPTGKLYKKGWIDVKDMSFRYVNFPVKIKNGFGRFDIDDNLCRYHVVTRDPQYPLRFDGWFEPKGDLWRGRMDVRSVQYHPFGRSILQAFSRFPKTVQVLSELNASGQLATSGFIEKKTFDQKPNMQFTTRIQGGEIQHDRFPYRIAGIHGTILFDNGDVKVQKLKGTGTTGNITATAQFWSGKNWWIDFDAGALELNQSLFQALQPEFKDVWNRLRPQGILDRVKVRLSGNAAGKTKTVLVCNQNPSTSLHPSFLTITPVSFPYRLDSVSGNIRYEDGTVWLDTVRAKHRNVKIGFDGKGKIENEGWNFLLTNLLAAQIPVDNDFKTALPLPIRQLVNRINFQGHLGISGSISIGMKKEVQAGVLDRVPQKTGRNIALVGLEVPERVESLPDVNWNLRLDLLNARIDSGIPFRNIHGVVRLVGARKNNRSFSYGDLDVDSAKIYGIHFRDLKGPISMNSKEFSFGSAAHLLSKNDPVKSLSAFLLGGRMNLDGRILLQKDSPFVIQATANHIDLKKVATRFASPSSDISGLGYGSIRLQGDSRGTETLKGRGIVRIKDAKLYEVPVFLQLLKILQVRTPDRTAFDEGKIDFAIDRSEVRMNRIELLGNAISLIGKGNVGFDQTLDLDFYTVLGRNRLYLPVLSEIIKASSQQLLWISIEGTIAHPKTKREVLRALNEAVRLLIDDVQAASRNGS